MPLEHRVEPDGYCPFCRTNGCQQRTDSAGRQQAGSTQLDRIEALQRRIARRLGVEIEGDEA